MSVTPTSVVIMLFAAIQQAVSLALAMLDIQRRMAHVKVNSHALSETVALNSLAGKRLVI